MNTSTLSAVLLAAQAWQIGAAAFIIVLGFTAVCVTTWASIGDGEASKQLEGRTLPIIFLIVMITAAGLVGVLMKQGGVAVVIGVAGLILSSIWARVADHFNDF